MNEKLETVLIKKYPGLFQLENGFECSDGWFKLLDRLSYDVFSYIRKSKSINRVVQVKEKFGGLRYSLDKGNWDIQSFIDIAQESSFHICEECGSFGKLRFGDFVKTLCDVHAKEFGYEEKKEKTNSKIGTYIRSSFPKKQSFYR